VVVLRNLRPEFCVFGGERVIDEGGVWRGVRGASDNSCSIGGICAAAARDREGSGISEALGERTGML